MHFVRQQHRASDEPKLCLFVCVCPSVFLLFAGGLTLLSVLPGIALFSVIASVIFNALYVTTYNILSRYFPHLTKVIIM